VAAIAAEAVPIIVRGDVMPTLTPEPQTAHPRPRRRRLWSTVENVVLDVLAVAGLVCIALTICAFVFHYSLIMFKTGSMAPTIPQGSLALVHKVPATDIEVGDIVTVDRPGERPVTHRVIEIHPQTGGEVLIAMRGDANPNPDPGMYRVTEVREVVWHAPGLAAKVVWLSDPRVLGGITIAASGLVLWAFWPRRDERDDGERAPEGVLHDDRHGTRAAAQDRRDRHRRRRRGRSRGRGTGVLAAWQMPVWGSATFGVDPDYIPVGYARGISSAGTLDRQITSATFDGTAAVRDDTDPGTDDTGWQQFSSSGVAGLFSIESTGTSCASYYADDGTTCVAGADGAANSSAQVRDLRIRNTAISSSNAVETSGTFAASAVCPLDGSAPQAGDLTAGTLVIGGTSVAIPAPNSSTTFDIRDGTRRYTGTLDYVRDSDAQSAVTKLRLYVEERLILTHEWTLDMDLIRTDCGIGVAPTSVLGGGTGIAAAPETDGAGNGDAATEDEQAVPGEETDRTAPEDESTVDTAPTAVQVGQRFPLTTTDGTDLGSATIHEIAREDDGTVAVRMTVATSEESGDRRLGSITARDFRCLTPDGMRTVASRSSERPAFPSVFEPGSEYTGWVTFEAAADATRAVWMPDGTTGWVFDLPAVPDGEAPPSEPGVTEPPEVTEPPAVTEPGMPETPAPAPESTPDVTEPEESAPGVSSPGTTEPDTDTATGEEEQTGNTE